MLSLIVIILLALILFAYAAVPLIFPKQTDPLPSFKDPVVQDLEEERDALFRAIKELENREDLLPARREQLRARYEAKAAKVLRSLDEYQSKTVAGRSHPHATRSSWLPYGGLTVLAAVIVSVVLLNQYLPQMRVSSNTTGMSQQDQQAAQALKKLEQAATKNPSQENLLALADAYWQQNDAPNAQATYERITQETTPVPAIAYRRLGFLKLQDNIADAIPLLEQARAVDPTDLDTLYALGEVYFAQARPDDAITALETYLAQPKGANDTDVQKRLEEIKTVAPVLNKATADPSEENLSALADLYWQLDEKERAADIYINILTQRNPHNSSALSRVGQVLFFNGQTTEAIQVLEQAKEVDDSNLDTLLFLGNAYFTEKRYQEAITTWQHYVEVAGGDAQAGRVPGLIENAKAQMADAVNAATTNLANNSALASDASGEALFAANCSLCHGTLGQGGTGPRLAGNARAADEKNVRNILQYGRGMMPGFSASLDDQQMETLVAYVIDVVAAEKTGQQ